MNSTGSVTGVGALYKQVDRLQSFTPLLFTSNPTVQTIVAMLMGRRRERFPSRHEVVDLPDGDKLAIVSSTPADWRADGRTVVLVHGLCGCYQSPYMIRLAARFFAIGYKAIRVNLRGCGSGAGLARLPYHSGRSDDIRVVLDRLACDAPQSAVTLIGFSLGGNIVLKLAGELDSRPVPTLESVVAVSAPIDLDACATLIEHPRNRIYDQHFVRRLLAAVRERQLFFPELPRVEFPTQMTIRIFDDLYTAPRSGFRGAADYYAQSSSGPLVPRIPIPALLLTARDDPFIAAVAYEQIKPPSHMEVRITDHGGHLGFLGHTGHAFDYRWMDHVLVDWVRRRVSR